MASKRKHDELCLGEISGYVHETSEIKTARFNSTRYFNGVIQTSSSEFTRFVSFSPEKHNALQTAQNMKSPVKLSNIKITPKDGKKEITISRNTDVEVCKKLDFDRKSMIPKETANNFKIKELTKANTMCSVSIKMLGFIDNEQEKHTKFGIRKLRTAILGDTTGVIKMPLWETYITKMETGQSYTISNALTSFFRSEIQLGTTMNTEFSKIPPLENVQEDVKSTEKLAQSSGKVQCCKIHTVIKCFSCGKNLETSENVPILRCASCHAKQKLMDCIKVKTLQIQTINEGKQVQKFIVFFDALQSYIDSHGLQSNTDDELEDHFLLKDTVTMFHHENSDVVNSIE